MRNTSMLNFRRDAFAHVSQQKLHYIDASLSCQFIGSELDRDGRASAAAFGQRTTHSVRAGLDDRRRAFPCKVCPRELCWQFKYYDHSKT
ncbi:unnamed protein product [Pieris brassicae]|uniref:Uncharacterized protein n=1 Tax=Pieris brassicae TaxID=7116 RepID=A0A9P0XDL8_PIEBR|nr:unnamed protein product [Pieris brassicae]